MDGLESCDRPSGAEYDWDRDRAGSLTGRHDHGRQPERATQLPRRSGVASECASDAPQATVGSSVQQKDEQVGAQPEAAPGRGDRHEALPAIAVDV
jgi:hypothetical protein